MPRPASPPEAAAGEASLKENLKQARQDLYRDAVLEASEAVFAEAGYDGARMQDIARAAGVSLSTLYAVFEGKLAIFRAIHERRGAELLGSIKAVETDSVVDFLWSGLEAYLDYMMAHPDYLRMQLQSGQAWTHQSARPSPEQGDLWETGLQLLTSVLERGIEAGLVFDEDPRLLGKLMMATHQVWLAEWVEGGMTEEPAVFIERIRRYTLHVLSAAEHPLTLGTGAQGRAREDAAGRTASSRPPAADA